MSCAKHGIAYVFARRGGGELAPCMVVFGLAAVAVPLNAQICTGTSPPCALTQGYAGPMTDTAFNYRQAINPYETHFTQTVLPDSGSPGAATMFLPVDVNDLVASSNPVSNPIMAQPLYVSGITVTSPIQGSCSPCNMVVIVTLNGTIYAYVADGTGAGNLLWSRQGTSWTSGVGGNALWWDDCNAETGAQPVPRTDVLQFEGILSTPVIDASASVPLLYVTSFCQTPTPTPRWFLHQINLKNGHDVSTANIGSDVRNLTGCTPCSNFTDANQQQRPALTFVANSNNTSGDPNLLYILFGTGTLENSAGQPYFGWVVGYKVPTSSALTLEFAYMNEPSSCGPGGGYGNSTRQCSATYNSGTPPCDCYVASGDTQNAPNWGGHGGGCWQSGNGPAAVQKGTIDSAVHVFLGCGNGGFQNFNSSNASPPSASNNNGETLMDFRLTTGGFDSTPFQTFTPNSPAHGVAPAPPSVCGDNGGSGCAGCVQCTYTLQTLNAYDYDFGTGGQALFNDLSGTLRLVVTGKDGYGYLLTPGQLCGSGYTADTGCVGFYPNDPGSLMTFGASQVLCSGIGSDDCDRVTSMAVYDNQATDSSRAVSIIYWPYNERLTSLSVSAPTATQSGIQQLHWSSGGSYTMNIGGSGSCTINQNCVPDQVVPGDTLTLPSCSCGTSDCPTVTAVTAYTLTLNITVGTAFPSCTSPQSFEYSGYLVTPAHDSSPSAGSGGYPGGAVTVSANCTSPPCSATSALIWAVVSNSASAPDTMARGLGTLYAYDALPNTSTDQLAPLWNSTDVWCSSSYARPTVVNGSAFVPTYVAQEQGVTFPTSDDQTVCPSSEYSTGTGWPSGVLVYR